MLRRDRTTRSDPNMEDGRHISWPAPVVHPTPLARGTKRELNEIRSRSFSTGAAIARRSLSSPPPIFRSPPPRPVSIRSIGSPPPVSGASGRAHNTVSVRPTAPVVTRSPVAELFHPRQAMVVRSPAKPGPVSGALVPRPRSMGAPSRHHNSAWGPDRRMPRLGNTLSESGSFVLGRSSGESSDSPGHRGS